MLKLSFEWEEAPSAKTLINPSRGQPASNFADEPARLTPRQAAFYRNLIRLAEQVGSRTLPVMFLTNDGVEKWMDRGCIKIAEHAKFIEPLTDSENGIVETISLKWNVVPAPR